MHPETVLTKPTEIEWLSSLNDLAGAFNLADADSDEVFDSASNLTTADRIVQVSAARDPSSPGRRSTPTRTRTET